MEEKMEFSVGGIGPQASPNAFGPSNDHFSAQQTFGAGCVGSHLGIYPHPLHLLSPHNMLEALRIEIEKEQIRGEIIISEIVRVRDLMMGRGLASEMGGDGISSQQMDVTSQLDFSQLGNRVENMSLENRIAMPVKEMKRLSEICELGEINKLPLQRGIAELRNVEVAPIPDKWNESLDNNFQVDPGEDVSGPRSDVLQRAVDLSELSSDVLKRRADGKWSCALCNVTVPNERSRNEHLQGKKHKKLQMEGTMNLNTREGVKPTVEPIQLGKTGEVCLMEENLPPFQENLDLKPLKGNQCAFVQKVDCCRAPCQITTPNEQVLNEHLPGKKHNFKKGLVSVEVAGRNSGVGLSPKIATMFVVDPIDPCMEGEVESRAECLLPMKIGGTRFNEHELPSLQDNISSGVVFKENHPALNQKMEWSCALCHVVAPNEQAQNAHLQGRKHKRKEDALISEGPGKNSGIKLKKKKKLLIKLKQNQCLLAQNLERSCALCKIIAPNDRALSKHLCGRKHKLKEAALETEGAGKSSSLMTAAKSMWAVETMDQSMEEKVLLTSESSLLRESAKAGFKGEDMPLFEDILTSNGLNENQAAFAQKVEWSCALCGVIAANEQVLNQHLQGKKHRLKVESLSVEGAQKNYIIGFSPKIATKSVHIAKALDPSLEEGLGLTVEPFLPKVTTEANSMELDVQPFQENLDSNNLNKNQSTFLSNVQENGDLRNENYRYWCELCNVGNLSMTSLKTHKKGKKHLKRLYKSEGKYGATPPHPTPRRFLNTGIT